MLMLNHQGYPPRVNLVGQEGDLVVSQAPPVLTHLPPKVRGVVREDHACRVLLEGASGWIKLPARLLNHTGQLLLTRSAVLRRSRAPPLEIS